MISNLANAWGWTIANSEHTWPLAVLAIVGVLTTLAWKGSHFGSDIPIINDYKGDFSRKRAKEEFLSNAEGLLDEGVSRYPDGPFRIITALSDRVILPCKWIDWIRKHPDLDHQAAVAQDFFGDYPGFEAIWAFNDPNHFVIDLVKKRMSQVSQAMLDTFEKNGAIFLKKVLGDEREWHDVDWGTMCFKMVAAVASAAFSGPTLAYDDDWQMLMTSHTTSIFNAARALRAWPAYLRPIVHWFLPDCIASRSQLAHARKRIAAYKLKPEDDNSVLAWTKDHKSPDAAAIQLALAAGAIHTSSQLLQQTVLELARASTQRPQILSDLRKEITNVLSETNGELVPSSIANLAFLDSCIKETQRLKPQTLNNLERVALKDVTLPDGQKIPKGTQIAIPSSPMWSKSEWGVDADIWDPYRYQQLNEKMGLVSSNNKHYAFGMGRFICPGRFFVATEIKVILVRLLMGWDLRIKPEQIEAGVGKNGRVEWKTFGFEQLADGDVIVQFRRKG